MNRLLHYSRLPIEAVVSKEQTDHFKPVGLWVSVEGPDDWKEWTAAEDFMRVDDLFCYEVEVTAST
jgi:hypothetical protein